MITEHDNNPDRFNDFVKAVNIEIENAQVRTIAAANAQMLLHYWKMGHFILFYQKQLGWGAKVIDKISKAIYSEYPNKKGYSPRNLMYMCQFAKMYSVTTIEHLIIGEKEIQEPTVQKILTLSNRLNNISITQEAPAQMKAANNEGITITRELPAQIENVNKALSIITQETLEQIEKKFVSSVISRINWASHQVLMDSKLTLGIRFWYMMQSVEYGLSSNILNLHIKNGLFQRQMREGKVNNFTKTLPSSQSDLANYLLKDPYIFDLVDIKESADERDIEQQLVSHVTKYLLEMGNGFAFVARQKHFQIGNSDFYADLILYNTHLHAYVVVELKARPFKPGDASQLNFYINVVNDKLKGAGDNDTIGLILCQGKDEIVAQYTLKGFNQPIGVSDYQLSKAVPEELKSTLPSIEEIEAELSKVNSL